MKPDVKEHKDKITKESYFTYHHKSGADLIFSQNGYSTSAAIYTCKYGGSDVSFLYGGKRYDTPRGIAHFLEHKLFETEDGGDAFDLFSDIGADANAFTSHRETSFTFTSSNDGFYKALRILLGFVHTPHFTKESVEKERGIIAEELRMYDDSPDNRCYYELMKCLYRFNNVRYDVGGTADSIKEITPELLYFCHNVFYDPSNMALIVSGGVDIKKVIEIMDEMIPQKKHIKTDVIRSGEPKRVNIKISDIKMEVSSPLFGFGIKDTDTEDRERMRKKSVALSILSNLLFGESSAFYCEAYENGLLSGDVDAGYYFSGDHAYLSVFGESKKPYTVRKRIKGIIEKTIAEGVDKKEFERCKRVFYANFVYSLQNSQSAAYSLLSFYHSNDDMSKYPTLLSGIGADFAVECLKEIYGDDRIGFSVVGPVSQ